jgi:NitT/TauT family transport system permease protein
LPPYAFLWIGEVVDSVPNNGAESGDFPLEPYLKIVPPIAGAVIKSRSELLVSGWEPGLVWNTMMSMWGGWFFVVASEAITVGDTTVSLPGIGSYLARAIGNENLSAVGWAVLAMFVIILIYDQLLFRPLVAWAEKFRFEQSASVTQPSSWMLTLIKRTQLARTSVRPIGHALAQLSRVLTSTRVSLPEAARRIWSSRWVYMTVIAAATVYALWRVAQFVTTEVSLRSSVTWCCLPPSL